MQTFKHIAHIVQTQGAKWHALRFVFPHTLAALWVILIIALLLQRFLGHGFDDPYITYRYAENLAAGNGFVYNINSIGSERVLSTTTPLYTMLLAALHWLTGWDIPRISNVISITALGLGGGVLWSMGRLWRTPITGMVGLVLIPIFPLLASTIGAETLFALMLVLFGFLMTAKGVEEQKNDALSTLSALPTTPSTLPSTLPTTLSTRLAYTIAAGYFALATLTRADALVAVGVAAIFILLNTFAIWSNRHSAHSLPLPRAFLSSLPWYAWWMYVALLLPWVIGAMWYFGSPLPVTLAAKQHQGMMSGAQGFFAGFLAQAAPYWTYPLLRFVVLLAAIGAVAMVVRWREWLMVVGWSISYLIAYTILGVTSYFWYYAPVVVGFWVLVGLGVEVVSRLLRRVFPRLATTALLALLLLTLVWPQAYVLLNQPPDNRLDIYHRVGEWLEKHTPPNAHVATLEVGIIGYYAHRPMIDFAGLLQPETIPHLTTTYDDTAQWVFQRFAPEYVVLQDGMFPGLEAMPAFRQRCTEVARFTEDGTYPQTYPYPMVIYMCRD